MNTISRLLLACATVTFAAIQADAGEFLVTGPGSYRYRNAPPPAHGYVPWRYQHRGWVQRDVAPRYYAPQYQPDLGAAIAGALAGAALQLIPRATEALAARLPPPPAAPPLLPNAAPPLAPNPAPPSVAAVPPPAAPPPTGAQATATRRCVGRCRRNEEGGFGRHRQPLRQSLRSLRLAANEAQAAWTSSASFLRA
jgi:hypothetical protein